MRHLLLLVLVISYVLITVSEAQADDCPFLDRSFVNLRDNGPGKRARGYVCFKVVTKPRQTNVLTVQTKTSGADWDILVGRRFDHKKRKMYRSLKHSNASGTSDEVVTLPIDEGSVWEVVVFPYKDNPSDACIYLHSFDQAEILGEALVWATAQYLLTDLFSEQGAPEEAKRNASRAASLGLSALRGRNVGQMSYDFAMSEISSELSEAFGGGSWLFAFGLNFSADYLKEVGRYSFGGVKCD